MADWSREKHSRATLKSNADSMMFLQISAQSWCALRTTPWEPLSDMPFELVNQIVVRQMDYANASLMPAALALSMEHRCFEA